MIYLIGILSGLALSVLVIALVLRIAELNEEPECERCKFLKYRNGRMKGLMKKQGVIRLYER